MDKLEKLKKIIEEKLYEVDKLEKNDYCKYLDYYGNSLAYIDSLEFVLQQIDELMEVDK